MLLEGPWSWALSLGKQVPSQGNNDRSSRNSKYKKYIPVRFLFFLTLIKFGQHRSPKILFDHGGSLQVCIKCLWTFTKPVKFYAFVKVTWLSAKNTTPHRSPNWCQLLFHLSCRYSERHAHCSEAGDAIGLSTLLSTPYHQSWGNAELWAVVGTPGPQLCPAESSCRSLQPCRRSKGGIKQSQAAAFIHALKHAEVL